VTSGQQNRRIVSRSAQGIGDEGGIALGYLDGDRAHTRIRWRDTSAMAGMPATTASICCW